MATDKTQGLPHVAAASAAEIAAAAIAPFVQKRSEERRVGKECRL